MTTTALLTPGELIAVAEDWLKRRGVPHFLESGKNEHRVIHATVGILIAAVSGWALAEGDGLTRGVAAGFAGGLVAAAVAVSVVVRRIKKERKGYGVMPPGKINIATAGALLVTWAIDSADADELDPGETLILGAALVVLLAVAAATPVGAARVFGWAVRHPFREARHNVRVLAGAFPLLLLTVAFLLVSDDLWVASTNLDTPELVATLGLFVALGLAFLVALAWTRVDAAATFDDWTQVCACLGDGRGHQADPLKRVSRRELEFRHQLHQLRHQTDWKALPDVADIERMKSSERWNITMVVVFGQGVQVLAVSLLMAGFFLLFGWLTVDHATLQDWKIKPQDGPLLWTDQHLKVAALLASFAGLSYAVYATLFREHRELFFYELDRKTTQRLAVRALYRGLKSGS
jgi:hypothetical protein